MKIEEVIQKAIEGGYNLSYSMSGYEESKLFLDPKFWQALGKSLGWWQSFPESDHHVETYWLNQWHRFIDHLAEGKSIESFFEEL